MNVKRIVEARIIRVQNFIFRKKKKKNYFPVYFRKNFNFRRTITKKKKELFTKRAAVLTTDELEEFFFLLLGIFFTGGLNANFLIVPFFGFDLNVDKIHRKKTHALFFKLRQVFTTMS